MNYEQLLAALRARARTEQRDGYEWIVKPIPDSEEGWGELDPRVLEVHKETAARMKGQQPPEIPEDPVEFAKMMRRMMGWENRDVTGGAVATECREIEGSETNIPVRIYTPPVDGKRPAVVFFHGGGFIGGSLKTVENPCKCLAYHAGAVVVSVDYRLAPEHPYPAGLTDCFDAVRWVHDHADELGVDPASIAVAGDSAGGNLATVCAMIDRDRKLGLIKYQALIYPSVNMAGAEEEGHRWSPEAYEIRNHREYIEQILGFVGADHGRPKLHELYLQGRIDVTHPHVSPLLADLHGMPETLIITGEFDFLRLENEAYARKLARSGVKTTVIRYNGVDHAFMDKIGQYPQAEDCMTEIALRVRRKFNR
jgi:acetyl esterase/lipase